MYVLLKHNKQCVANGGALLWCCDWKKEETFKVIFQRYSNFLSHLGIDTIVFDGYDLSTKDATHQKWAGLMSHNVDIKDENSCPANRNTFFGNYHNKKNFVKALAANLKSKFKVVECPSDTDTSIVKESLMAAKSSPVIVFSDDTDILCLLVHHVANDSSLHEIFLTDMTKKKGKQRQYHRVSMLSRIQAMQFLICYCLLMPLLGVTQHRLFICLERHQSSKNSKLRLS